MVNVLKAHAQLTNTSCKIPGNYIIGNESAENNKRDEKDSLDNFLSASVCKVSIKNGRAHSEVLRGDTEFPFLPGHLGWGGGGKLVHEIKGTGMLTLVVSLKAAKYEVQKPLTCRATLFRCKFWDDVSRFSTLCDQPVAEQKHLLRVEESCCEK